MERIAGDSVSWARRRPLQGLSSWRSGATSPKQTQIAELPDALRVDEVARVLRLVGTAPTMQSDVARFRYGSADGLVPKVAVLQLLGRHDSIPTTHAQAETISIHRLVSPARLASSPSSGLPLAAR